MSKRRTYLIVGAFAVVGFLGTGLLIPPLLAAGLSAGYATVVGLGIAMPAMATFGYSWTDSFDSAAYYESETLLTDCFATALGAVVVGVVGLTVLSSVAPDASWPRAVAIGVGIFGGYAVFIRQNREYFDEDTNPWVAGKLGDWLD
jgi:hypothetical protein